MGTDVGRLTTPAQRIRVALDLQQAGERIYRQRLRREQPGISEAELDSQITRWLHGRPGAEFGDMDGVPSTRVL